MNVKVKCGNCEKEILLSRFHLKEKSIIMEKDNKRLKLTYYNCPNCNKEFTVLVDDEETLKYLEKYKQLVNRVAKIAKSTGNATSTKAYKQMISIQKKFKNKRDDLNRRYNGSFYLVGEEKYQLEISVPDTQVI